MKFQQKVPDDCVYPGSKIFVKIALSHTISEINVVLCFTQKYKRATKKDGKLIFGKKCQMILQITGVKNYVKITLSQTISKINEFLRFT